MNDFTKYKHLETVSNDDYNSSCNNILKKFRKSYKMQSNEYFYFIINTMNEYNHCKEKELPSSTSS